MVREDESEGGIFLSVLALHHRNEQRLVVVVKRGIGLYFYINMLPPWLSFLCFAAVVNRPS